MSTPDRHYSPKQIRDVLSDEELDAILADGQTSAVTRRWLFKLQTRGHVPIPADDPEFAAAVSYLDAQGLAPQALKDLVDW